MTLFRRLCWIPLVIILGTGCTSSSTFNRRQLVFGIVSYGEGQQSLTQYESLKQHLARSLKSIVVIEPAFNEVQAVQQVERQSWDMVLAPPGLAAIAISQARYLPILPAVGGSNERSVIVVPAQSRAQQLSDLSFQTLALGQKGSASGYYFPIYNLYGLTLKKVKLAPTPLDVLKQIDAGEASAGALSVAELEKYQSTFSDTKFRILHRDSHPVPTGALLVGPSVDRTFQTQIAQALEDVPSDVASAAGFITNAAPPDYSYLIKVVKRVRPIAQRIKEEPAPLY